MNSLSWLHLGVLAIAGLLCNQNSHAGLRYAPTRDAAVGQAIWDAAVSGRTTTIGGTGGGMTVIGPASPAVSGAAAGSARVVGRGTLALAGSALSLTMTGDISKDVIIGALVGCATGGYVGCAIGAAMPLAKAFMDASGSRVNPATGAVEHSDPAVCTVAPCYVYLALPNTPGAGRRYSSFDAAAQASLGKPDGCDGYTLYFKSLVSSSNPNATFQYAYCGSGNNVGNPSTKTLDSEQTAPAPAAPWVPYSSTQDFTDALSKNDPPPGIVDELGKHGNIVWTLGDPTRPGYQGVTNITGPSSITGPTTTTHNPDGSSSTSSSNTPLSYSGPTVTAGSTTTTTKTIAPDGTPTGTTSSTVDSSTATPDAPKPDESPPTDTALPDMPKLYTPKYPDGITGVWRDRKAELTSSPLMQLKDSLLPSIGGGGSCPSWMLPLDTGWVNFGTYNVAPPCWIWDFGRVIIILSAMFLARALIFGG